MKLRVLILISLAFSIVRLNAQDYFLQDSISVRFQGQKMTAPWAGGLNSSQFCGADLNNNGKEDIFVYDKIGRRYLTFLHSGEPGR